VSSRFDQLVLSPDPDTRGEILNWLEAGLAAVEPERLTAESLAGRASAKTVVIAIGKAAPAMARGAASVLDLVGGVCVSDHEEPIPEQMTLILGDHPVPGPASLDAGAAVLAAVRATPIETGLIALVSGGGSALCEAPRPGVPPEYLSEVTRRLIDHGADIEEINLVRAHLSAIKCGGVSRAAQRSIDTYVISDVAEAGLGVVASGPTIPREHEPEAAADVLRRFSIEIPDPVWSAMSVEPLSLAQPLVTRVADGRDAARGVAGAAPAPIETSTDWLQGDAGPCLERFLSEAGPGVTIAAGEVVLDVKRGGAGGRNTHAALLAAERLAGSGDVFCAFATDGVDGSSGSAGAIVDGSTIARGGNPTSAMESFDSATYLARTSDLLLCPPTGTNVSDLWILWRRDRART